MKRQQRQSADGLATAATIRNEASHLATKRSRTSGLLPMAASCVLCTLLSVACGGDDPKDAADDAEQTPNGQGSKGKDGDGKKDKEKEIKTEGQALRALLDFSQTQIDEAKVGGQKTKSPEVVQLAEGIGADYATTIEKLTAIGSDKGIVAAKNGLGDRLLFNSKSQLNHISNVMPGMVDNAYLTRVQNAHKEIITQIDEVIVPVLKDDDLKAEVAVMRDDANRHLTDAGSVADLVKGEDTGLPPLGPAGGGGSPFGDAGAGGGGGGLAPAVGPNGERVPELNPNQQPGGGLPGGNLGNLDGGV